MGGDLWRSFGVKLDLDQAGMRAWALPQFRSALVARQNVGIAVFAKAGLIGIVPGTSAHLNHTWAQDLVDTTPPRPAPSRHARCCGWTHEGRGANTRREGGGPACEGLEVGRNGRVAKRLPPSPRGPSSPWRRRDRNCENPSDGHLWMVPCGLRPTTCLTSTVQCSEALRDSRAVRIPHHLQQLSRCKGDLWNGSRVPSAETLQPPYGGVTLDPSQVASSHYRTAAMD